MVNENLSADPKEEDPGYLTEEDLRLGKRAR
jgi:hypothetical protein